MASKESEFFFGDINNGWCSWICGQPCCKMTEIRYTLALHHQTIRKKKKNVRFSYSRSSIAENLGLSSIETYCKTRITFTSAV